MFVVFVIAEALYAAFLLWCLAPPFLRDRMRPRDWWRFGVGASLLAANMSPLFALPVMIPLAFAGTEVAERMIAVILFARTTPRYVANMINRSNATATVIEVTYAIEVGGIYYRPVVRTACTTRKMVDLDKGVEIHRTASGGDFFAYAGDSAIAFNQNHIYGVARKEGPLLDFGSGVGNIYVIRGEAENTKRYSLWYYHDVTRIDDIVLEAPRITNIETRSARDVISSADLWPMRGSGERTRQEPLIITAIRQLKAGENACIEYVTATIDIRKQSPKILRTRMTSLNHVPIERRPAYCRDVLSRLPVPNDRLFPASN